MGYAGVATFNGGPGVSSSGVANALMLLSVLIVNVVMNAISFPTAYHDDNIHHSGHGHKQGNSAGNRGRRWNGDEVSQPPDDIR